MYKLLLPPSPFIILSVTRHHCQNAALAETRPFPSGIQQIHSNVAPRRFVKKQGCLTSLPVTSGEGQAKTRDIHQLPLRTSRESIHFPGLVGSPSEGPWELSPPPPRTPFPFPLKSQIAFSPWDPFMTVWTGWGLICRIASPFPPVTPIKTKARKVPDATLCYERPAFKTMTLFRGCGEEGSVLDVLRCSLRAWGRSRGVPPSESKSGETKLPKDARRHSSPELVHLGAARCAVATPTADIEIHSC